MISKLEGIYEGKAVLKENLVQTPSNQGGGILQCVVAPKEEGGVCTTLYVNTANYDVVKVTPVPDEA